MDDVKYYKILKRINPNYLFRHEIYERELLSILTVETDWLDLGCGDNAHVYLYGKYCKSAQGMDIVEHSERLPGTFTRAPLSELPLPDDSVDLVTMHMVVEHLEHIPEDLAEINRVLRPGGKLLVLTTNLWSPLIFLPRLLPNRVKQWLISRSFGEEEEDIFRTYHRLNSPVQMKRDIYSMRMEKMLLVEQTALESRFLFWTFLVPYLATLPKILSKFRSNILAIYKKA